MRVRARGFVMLQVIVTLLLLALIASVLLRLGLGGRILQDRQRQSDQAAAVSQSALAQAARCLSEANAVIDASHCGPSDLPAGCGPSVNVSLPSPSGAPVNVPVTISLKLDPTQGCQLRVDCASASCGGNGVASN